MSVYHVRVSTAARPTADRSSALSIGSAGVACSPRSAAGAARLRSRRAAVFVTFFIKYEARRRWHTVGGAQGTTQGAVDSPSRAARFVVRGQSFHDPKSGRVRLLPVRCAAPATLQSRELGTECLPHVSADERLTCVHALLFHRGGSGRAAMGLPALAPLAQLSSARAFPQCSSHLGQVRHSQHRVALRVLDQFAPRGHALCQCTIGAQIEGRSHFVALEVPRRLWMLEERVPAEAIKGHQRPSEAIRGHQRPSEAIGGHRRPSEAIRGHQRPSEAIGGHRRSSETVGGHQRSSRALRGHLGPFEAIDSHPRPSESL